ncbi:hypothetical protein LXM94_25885, partial [Rhizobium sp. TRM95111]|uniref:hypothetical protein n=1 Tax=Rhizobium alarense TaxID=2846851 RepID=UPI001F17DB29
TPCWTYQPWPHNLNQTVSGKPGAVQSAFFHLAEAAKRAISDLSSGVSDFARAAPPFSPPFRALSRGFLSSASPVAKSTIALASWFWSRGRLGVLSIML